MVEFDELRQLWQKQPQPDSAAALDGRAMSEVLRRFHRRQTAINCVRASLVIFMVIFMPIREHMAPTGVAGVALLFVGLAIYLVEDWRNQIGIARLDFTKSSEGFVESSLQRLRDMRYPFRRTFWILIVSLVCGMNLITWAHHSTVFKTVLMHSNATAFPFLAYWLGAKIRAKRFDLECRPIMEKLLSMQRAVEERTV